MDKWQTTYVIKTTGAADHSTKVVQRCMYKKHSNFDFDIYLKVFTHFEYVQLACMYALFNYLKQIQQQPKMSNFEQNELPLCLLVKR